ncbi:TPA: hypothetical protein N0F65_007034, partial [Lagenidium giganteum]
DAEALRAVSNQVGTLVLDRSGDVLSCTGELAGTAGEDAAKAVFSMLQDSASVLERTEELQRMIINFPAFDYVVTHDQSQIYIVKRVKASED